MATILCCIFLVIAFFIILFPDKNHHKFFFLIFSLILLGMAGLRPEGIDRDYNSYVSIFYNDLDFSSLKEPTFLIISWIVKSFFNNKIIFLFIIYALLGVGLKIYAIKQISEFWLFSLLVYFSYSYTLHDMTQIRAGVAAAFVLLSIIPLYERKILHFLFLTMLAILFHYSAFAMAFFAFLNPYKINTKKYGLLIFAAYLINQLLPIYVTDFEQYIPIVPIQSKILAYEYDNIGSLNIFNSWQIIRILLSFLFLWKFSIIYEKNRYGILLIKLYVISTCLYVILSTNPSFAERINNLFSVFDIVLIPCIIYFLKPRLFATLIIIAISFSYFFLNIFYNKIIL